MKSLIQALVGTWFICSTSFPMWLKGDKTNPTFTYSITDKKGETNVLLDEVKYQHKGESKTLTGFDYQNPADSAAFVWRGKGVLSLVRSKWKVVLQDPDGQWAVIWFSKTLFTPEGVDIISRTPQLPEKTLNHIKSLMADTPTLAKQLANVRDLPVR
ncbi:lipocalin family protein [Spirosoma foliorum]|uniref:Lipocalin family protein n=1 Tax=Spirosoma foliorum TaxID=2710596 RepID=A0A7G5GNR8_9BACT|nr:lipocalin family protein [Spirosoma foliorum]QMW00510.1 lipocalin family protein [Spirosoma foliorum]